MPEPPSEPRMPVPLPETEPEMPVLPPPSEPTPPPRPGASPYGARGEGAWHPHPHVPTSDGLAVAAFALALTVCLAPLGLVLGIVALVRMSANARRGRPRRGGGLAVAAVAVSACVVVAAVPLAAFGEFRVWTASSPDRDADGRVGEQSTATVFDLREGDCFTPGAGLPDGAGDRLPDPTVEIVPCDRPHQGEVFGTTRLDGPTAFPGMDAVAARARTGCVPPLLDYIPDPDGGPGTKTFFYHPDEQGWRAGRRAVVCWLSRPDGPMTSSARQDVGAWEPGQRAYLASIRPFTTVLLSRPAKSPVDDLPGARAWARSMPEALDETVRLLEAADLPDAARGSAADLAAKLRASRPDWVAAGGAPDVDAFGRALERVDAHPIGGVVARLRAAVGLPPAGGGRGV
ncbi:septum formation family protein [Streptomyces sp. NPDC056361]|uniref:septum formation family protein n=1 Tax=Streptomyces sp. NPDC056361 TaxID=3345795 RepID=UPI0035DA7C9A